MLAGRAAADVDVVGDVRDVAEELAVAWTGAIRLTSFRWTPLGNGSFVSSMSPGPRFSGP